MRTLRLPMISAALRFGAARLFYCMDQLEASKDSSVFPYYTARLTETTTARYDPACSRGQLCWSTLVSCFPLCTALHQAASPAGRRGGY
jgi:hypothetical protein